VGVALGLMLSEVVGWVMIGTWPETRPLRSAPVSEPGFLDALLQLPVWLYPVVVGAMLGLLGMALTDRKRGDDG
jgi:hypothetical protein